MARARLIVLVALSLLLVALVWRDKSAPDATVASDVAEIRAPAPTTSAAAPAPRGNPLVGLKRDELRAMVERPLFSPSRRPPPRPAAPAAAPPQQPRPSGPDANEYALLGVVFAESGQAIALLRKTQGGESVRVQQGDMISGWRVTKVEATQVTLSRDSMSVTLSLPPP